MPVNSGYAYGKLVDQVTRWRQALSLPGVGRTTFESKKTIGAAVDSDAWLSRAMRENPEAWSLSKPQEPSELYPEMTRLQLFLAILGVPPDWVDGKGMFVIEKDEFELFLEMRENTYKDSTAALFARLCPGFSALAESAPVSSQFIVRAEKLASGGFRALHAPNAAGGAPIFPRRASSADIRLKQERLKISYAAGNEGDGDGLSLFADWHCTLLEKTSDGHVACVLPRDSEALGNWKDRLDGRGRINVPALEPSGERLDEDIDLLLFTHRDVLPRNAGGTNVQAAFKRRRDPKSTDDHHRHGLLRPDVLEAFAVWATERLTEGSATIHRASYRVVAA